MKKGATVSIQNKKNGALDCLAVRHRRSILKNRVALVSLFGRVMVKYSPRILPDVIERKFDLFMDEAYLTFAPEEFIEKIRKKTDKPIECWCNDIVFLVVVDPVWIFLCRDSVFTHKYPTRAGERVFDAALASQKPDRGRTRPEGMFSKSRY